MSEKRKKSEWSGYHSDQSGLLFQSRRRRAKHRSVCMFLFLLLCFVFLCFPVKGYADNTNPADLTRSCTLTISYPAVGTEFRLYRVADLIMDSRYETVSYKVSPDFIGGTVLEEAEFPVALDVQTDWRAASETLDSIVTQYQIQPYMNGDKRCIGKIGDNGTLVFSNLPQGLYLVSADPVEYQGASYTPLSSLLTLPQLADDSSTASAISYDVRTEVKYSSESLPTRIQAVKTWQDIGSEKNRPDSVKAVLYCDGKEYGSVTLNASGNWRYTWMDLPANHDWKVVEQTVPEGYSMTVTKTISSDGTGIYHIVNTLKEKKEKEKNEIVPSGYGSELPQTGQRWWIVAVLILSGGFLVFLGMILRRRIH